MKDYTEEIKRIKACAHSAGLRIEELKQQNDELLEALKDAYHVINHLGDTLNSIDAVTPEDEKEVNPKIARIKSLINKYTQS